MWQIVDHIQILGRELLALGQNQVQVVRVAQYIRHISGEHHAQVRIGRDLYETRLFADRIGQDVLDLVDFEKTQRWTELIAQAAEIVVRCVARRSRRCRSTHYRWVVCIRARFASTQ